MPKQASKDKEEDLDKELLKLNQENERLKCLCTDKDLCLTQKGLEIEKLEGKLAEQKLERDDVLEVIHSKLEESIEKIAKLETTLEEREETIVTLRQNHEEKVLGLVEENEKRICELQVEQKEVSRKLRAMEKFVEQKASLEKRTEL